MKPNPIIVLLLAAALLSACGSNEPALTPEPVDHSAPQTGGESKPADDSGEGVGLGEEFTLGEGQSVFVDGERFEVRLDEVLGDSRCPQGAQCFWEGNAKVRVSVGDEVFTLTLGGLREGDQNSVALGDGFILRVVALSPYPGSAQEGQSYQVTLIVERETSQPYNYPANV